MIFSVAQKAVVGIDVVGDGIGVEELGFAIIGRVTILVGVN